MLALREEHRVRRVKQTLRAIKHEEIAVAPMEALEPRSSIV